jgi:acyl-CoA thioesterase I
MQSVIRIGAFEFAGGDAFFLGLAALVIGSLLPIWSGKPRLLSVFRLASVTAGIVIAASGTPLPLWFYGVGLLFVIAALIACSSAAANGRRWTFRALAGLLICWAAAAAFWEFTYRLPPQLDQTHHFGRLVVVGDSVSAGLLGPDERTWPKQFRGQYFGNVLDLSAQGATARSALRQAQSLNARPDDHDAVVVIEIGGNDYFELVPPGDFATDLDHLLTALSRPNRQLIMLELPLPPFYNEYGRVQRQLAARHGVPLISKREFAGVVFAPGATLDTVHLSEGGHRLFSDMIWRYVGGMLRSELGS